MPCTASEPTIEKLREMFARYGNPEQLVSDNRPQFTSHEFAEFMKRNGINTHPRSTISPSIERTSREICPNF